MAVKIKQKENWVDSPGWGSDPWPHLTRMGIRHMASFDSDGDQTFRAMASFDSDGDQTHGLIWLGWGSDFQSHGLIWLGWGSDPWSHLTRMGIRPMVSFFLSLILTAKEDFCDSLSHSNSSTLYFLSIGKHLKKNCKRPQKRRQVCTSFLSKTLPIFVCDLNRHFWFDGFYYEWFVKNMHFLSFFFPRTVFL